MRLRGVLASYAGTSCLPNSFSFAGALAVALAVSAVGALVTASRRTTSRRELSRREHFAEISPELGQLDEAAFDELLATMRVDKKAEGGAIRYVLLKRLGEAFVAAVPDGEVAPVIEASINTGKAG